MLAQLNDIEIYTLGYVNQNYLQFCGDNVALIRLLYAFNL